MEAEERDVKAEERSLALEEKRLAKEKNTNNRATMFMNPNLMNAMERIYWEFTRGEIMAEAEVSHGGDDCGDGDVREGGDFLDDDDFLVGAEQGIA